MNYIKENPMTSAMWGFGIITVMLVSLYLSSVTYFLLVDLDPNTATPFSIFRFIGIIYEPYGMYLAISFIAPNVILAAMAAMLIFKPKNTDSRWATTHDMKKANMLNQEEGIILGRHKGKLVRNDEDSHIFGISKTGTGKGVGLVIPNLLLFGGSIICLDVKGENHRLTSGFRSQYSKVINFRPFARGDGCSHRYNPLDYVSKDLFMRITDLQVIAEIIIDSSEQGNPHFPEEAQDLFIGLALYVIDHPDHEPTIGAIFRLLGTPHDFGKLLAHIAKEYSHLDEASRQLFNSFSSKAEKEQSGIKSTLSRALKLWRNHTIDAVTSKSDFSFRDIRKQRHTIYLGVGVSDVKALKPLMRIFFEQAVTTLTEYEPDPIKEPHKILMLMDEFHLLGEMGVMTNAFTVMRSFRVRIMGIIQNFEILDMVYDKDSRKTILSNCWHLVFFATKDPTAQKYISDSCGKKKVKSKSISKAHGFSTEKARVTITEKIVPLIQEHEINTTLNDDKEIILVDRSHPILCKKIVYHKDKQFKDKILKAAPTAKLNIKIKPAPEYDLSDDGSVDWGKKGIEKRVGNEKERRQNKRKPKNDNETKLDNAPPNDSLPSNEGKLFDKNSEVS